MRHSHPHASGSNRRRRPPQRVPAAAICCLLITGYFAQHAMTGKHGLDARARLQERSKRLSVEVTKLESELQRLQRDVALLAPEPPDTDFVREIAADVLGFIPADGLLVMAPTAAHAPAASR